MKRCLILTYVVFCLLDWLFFEPSTGSLLASPGLLLGLIGAGLGLGGSVASGLMQSHAVTESNKMNLLGVRETNEANKEMFQQALNYQTDMWEKTNAYNTPEAQRQRYEAAGLNPYLMMSQGNAGEASSMTGLSPSQLQAPHVEPVPSPYQGLTEIPSHLSSFADTTLKQETAYGLSLDNKMKLVDVRNKTLEKYLSIQNLLYELRNKRTKSNYDEAQINVLEKTAKSLELDLKYQEDFLQSRNNLQREQSNKAYEDAQKAHWESEYQRQLSEAFPQMNAAQLKLLAAQMADAYASAGAHRAAAGMYSAQEGKAWEGAKTEYHLRPYKVLVEKFNSLLSQGAVKLQELGIPAAELKAMRDKSIIYQRKNGTFRFADNAANWFADKLATVFAGFK